MITFLRPLLRYQKRWLISGGMIALLGPLMIATRLGDPLATLSYDAPFLFRDSAADTNVVVLLEDRGSLDALSQKSWPPSRAIHARLLDRLREEGVKLVVFDMVFRNESPGEDEEFAAAIKRHGHVILGGVPEAASHRAGESPGAEIIELKPPVNSLRTNAVGWGLLLVGNLDTSRGVRQMMTMWRGTPAAIWLAAQQTGSLRTGEKPETERWINFYGKPPALDRVTLGQVLQVESRRLPPGYLRGKVVFVGFDPAVTPASGIQDVFATPFTRFGSDFSPGVEVLANAFANLVNDDWLRRMATPLQCLIAAIFGVGAFALLLALGSSRMWFGVAFFLAILILSALMMQWHALVWWNWLVPGLVQLPLAALLAFTYPRAVSSQSRQPAEAGWRGELQPGAVFVSYASEDRAAAFVLADAFQAAGLPVWVDRELSPGDNFREQILRQIRDCSAFVPVLSAHTQTDRARWFRREWAAAIDHSAALTGTRQKFLFPVVVDGTPMGQIRPVREELFGRTACVAPEGRPPKELIEELHSTVRQWQQHNPRE